MLTIMMSMSTSSSRSTSGSESPSGVRVTRRPRNTTTASSSSAPLPASWPITTTTTSDVNTSSGTENSSTKPVSSSLSSTWQFLHRRTQPPPQQQQQQYPRRNVGFPSHQQPQLYLQGRRDPYGTFCPHRRRRRPGRVRIRTLLTVLRWLALAALMRTLWYLWWMHEQVLLLMQQQQPRGQEDFLNPIRDRHHRHDGIDDALLARAKSTILATSTGSLIMHQAKRLLGLPSYANTWPHTTSTILSSSSSSVQTSSSSFSTLAVFRKEWTRRQKQRRQRTRPPLPSSNMEITTALPFVPLLNETTMKALGWNTSLLTEESTQPPPSNYNWTDACRRAGLDANSRVIFTNILTNGLGTAWPLLLARQCHIRHILVIDPLLPNLRRERMLAMAHFRHLLGSPLLSERQVSLVVPTVGMYRKQDPNATFLVRFAPTHLLHVEVDTASLLPWMSRSNHQLFTLATSRGMMQHLLSLPALVMGRKGAVRMVHVVMPSSSSSSGPDLSSPSSPAMYHLIEPSRAATLSTMASSYYYHHARRPNHQGRFMIHYLELPHVYGPVTQHPLGSYQAPHHYPSTSTIFSAPWMYVEDALAAVLAAWEPTSGLYQTRLAAASSRNLPATSQMQWTTAPPDAQMGPLSDDTRVLQSRAWEFSQTHPFRKIEEEHAGDPKAPGLATRLSHVAAWNRDKFGVENHEPFPCSSTCMSITSPTCTPSAFDAETLAASRNATSQCNYVVYRTNFARSLEALEEPKALGDVLCRVAFVSGRSRLVKRLLSERAQLPAHGTTFDSRLYRQWNGLIKSQGWTLVWLAHDDDESLRPADLALPLIEPTRFFAPSVSKAMYTESSEFSGPADLALLRIMMKIDLPPLGKHLVKEKRPGTMIRRFLERPPRRARHAVLFVAEPSPEYQPRDVWHFEQLANQSSIHLPPKQLLYYSQAAHWVQVNDLRPDDEIQTTVYHTFPFQWISMMVLVHDFNMEESRRFRCRWLDEYLFWGNNLGAEELSLAYVVGQLRIEQRLGPGLEEDPTWIPFMDTGPNGTDQPLLNERGAEVFLRIMQRRS